MIAPPNNVLDPVIPPVADSWKRIDSWLARHAPTGFAMLRPPATPEAIVRAESLVGMPLPSDLRESLIPFAGGDGDEHFIDAGPGTWHNHLGYAAHDDQGYFLGWPTLGAWLHHVADAMERFERRDYAGAVCRPVLTRGGEVDW